MSRKHYEALAKALKFERPTEEANLSYAQWRRDILAVARVCERFAPTTFDYNRFLQACLEPYQPTEPLENTMTDSEIFSPES